MSDHARWEETREERLRRMSPDHRARFLAGMARKYQKLEHELWLCRVEGWLSRAMNAALLGRPIEPLAWPVRTLEELAAHADEVAEYPIFWPPTSDDRIVRVVDLDPSEALEMSWESLKREANVRLLANVAKVRHEEELSLLYGKDNPERPAPLTDEQARATAEATYDELFASRSRDGMV